MNCQDAIERLPWWLNGSLEPAEGREVEEHLAGCAACREALGETRLAWEVYSQHISSEALVAHAYDEPPPGIDPALLERHLAGCPQCAAELEMVRASRLLGEHDEVAVLVPRTAQSWRRRPERAWQAAALAASLTGVIAIGGWVTTARQAHRPPTFRGAPSSAILSQTTTTEISSLALRGSEETTAISAAARHATLILTPSPGDTYQNHAADLLDEHGRVLARIGDLKRPGGQYSVDADLERLLPGSYAIQVYGTDGGAHQALDRFRFVVK